MGNKWETTASKKGKKRLMQNKKKLEKNERRARLKRIQKQRRRYRLNSLKKSSEQKQKERVPTYTPTVPFPQRLQKAKREEQFSRFLDIFKKIKINIPFVEVINQMPNYAKFLKEILNKKRKIDVEGIVNLTATCSAVIQQKLPTNNEGPRQFLHREI